VSNQDKISLKGKTAFISGASKGIGKAIASTFAEAGASLALTGRNQAELGAVAEDARSRGVSVWTRTAELADETEVNALAEAAPADLDTIDILINNAGLTIPQSILDLDMESWHTTFNVDLIAPLLLTKAFAPAMIERSSGKIVNISSRAALGALEEHVAYSAAKAALNMLTQTMALEFAPHGIQVNCIAPTVILTPMADAVWTSGPRTDAKLARIPTGRFGEAEEVADVALFPASPLANFVNGTIIPVDGGEGAL
jgi:NAD(P)-dependent dehydrogenase (short-subunit alcohol dehydrogenase family)